MADRVSEVVIEGLSKDKFKMKEGEDLACENSSSDGKPCPKKSARLYHHEGKWCCFSCFMFKKYLGKPEAENEKKGESEKMAKKTETKARAEEAPAEEQKVEKQGVLERATNLHKEGKIDDEQLKKVKEAFSKDPKKARKALRRMLDK